MVADLGVRPHLPFSMFSTCDVFVMPGPRDTRCILFSFFVRSGAVGSMMDRPTGDGSRTFGETSSNQNNAQEPLACLSASWSFDSPHE
jgi:hypothetical protein